MSPSFPALNLRRTSLPLPHSHRVPTAVPCERSIWRFTFRHSLIPPLGVYSFNWPDMNMCRIQPANTLSSALAVLPENVIQQKANNNELTVIDVPNRIVSTKRVFPPDKYLIHLSFSLLVASATPETLNWRAVAIWTGSSQQVLAKKPPRLHRRERRL